MRRILWYRLYFKDMNYTAELAFTKELAREAGEIARRYFLSEDLGTTYKVDHSPVTQADTLINQLIIDRVVEHFPDCGVIGEEASQNENAEKYWLVDPIDGTHPFTVGMPVSTISIALVERGEVKLGVVYEPFTDRLFFAAEGGGAFCNDVRIRVGAADVLRGETVLLGSQLFRSEQTRLSAGQLYDKVTEVGMKGYHVHSSAYGFMLVALGAAAGSVVGEAKSWDVAASLVILKEAGAVVTTFAGEDVQLAGDNYEVVVGTPEVHAELLSMVQSR